MKTIHLVALVGLALVALTQCAPTREAAKPEVSYYPTPQAVIDRMLEMARVTSKDVVYDLGCGDGRIVVTAAKKHGARAVGVDIDPTRVKEALARVEAAKVADLVTIRKEDMFETDLRGASVVALYLNDKANLALRPALKKSLAPGSRIVSQTWDMGDWRPDRTVTMTAIDEKDGKRYEYKLFLWTIRKAEGK